MTSLGLELGLSLSFKKIGFDPLAYNPSLWLDAADQSTITLNGSDVAQWGDKSGNGDHSTQVTAANQPSYVLASQNGKNSVVFDGEDDYMIGTVDTFRQAYSIFIVGSLSGVIQCLFAFTDGAGGHGIDLTGTTGTIIRFLHREPFGGVGGDNATASAFTPSQLYVFAFTRDSGKDMEISYNGVSKGTLAGTDLFFGSGGSYALGRLGATLPGRNLNGSLCELVIYPRVSASENNLTNNYLLGKWGI